MTKMHLVAVLAALVAGNALAADQAGPSGIKRHEALRHDLDTAGREVVQVRVDFAPGASFGLHTHPGIEVGRTCWKARSNTRFEGKPPVTLKPGIAVHPRR